MIFFLLFILFYININIITANFKLKSVEKIKQEEKKFNKIYFHKNGVKILSFNFLKKIDKNSIELIILLDNSPSKNFNILNSNEVLKKEEDFYIFIKDKNKLIIPDLVQKINSDINYISIFGKKKINFGELFKIKWNLNKNINFNNIKFVLNNSKFILNF